MLSEDLYFQRERQNSSLIKRRSGNKTELYTKRYPALLFYKKAIKQQPEVKRKTQTYNYKGFL